MPEQLWLPKLETRSPPTDGLFFAVYPDANTAAGIAKLAQQLCVEAQARSRVRGKPLAVDRLHVTLRHLGNFAGGLPADVVEAAKRAAALVSMAPFTVEFDAVASFAKRPRPGPVVLVGEHSVRGLHALHDALEAGLEAGGIEPDARFTPHLTLAYGLPWIGRRPAEPVCWNVREFALMHSLLGQSRHIVLARWPLVGQR
ncbi:2'-5' RNA ligase family protein [Paraburkholderia sp. MMS20-SJTN17]|uniref:RNA 2',3'-cyclic phosphodiesterase n=1 Tax=Paraburkholderia translucens TaxID=2886945 RepID=A0ABS8KN39_9BURK|nr:2'-5' RNA ligase family protein [Paraburkholderia sp. MMS20-SJTN17]MCC8405893.1 2'-5' RNA ligase family protein [Paraburkholderia sp. MMS20-SJTN17]